ncbi:MAG TPA: hypothetical protein VMA35_09640 [Candidatus Sulfopaludibacter sp.]|nr:hypothetical protein [Candidatus Sulfopaludibacter sp.]
MPIANPYSGSWIYYTTNADSGLSFLNGASIPFVMAVSNNIVTSISTATNGLVGASITNGLATISYVNAATNGLVTSAVTNGLASISYVNTATNGLVGPSITNGLATTNFVLSQGYVTSAVTNGLASISYVNTATNGLVTSAVTNGLASISYVNAATNALATMASGVITWGTTNNKPSGAAPATVYYYFTNGQPMFGIISTN